MEPHNCQGWVLASLSPTVYNLPTLIPSYFIDIIVDRGRPMHSELVFIDDTLFLLIFEEPKITSTVKPLKRVFHGTLQLTRVGPGRCT